RDVTFAVFCQGPYEESAWYRDFMGWEMPWYSAQGSLDTLLVGRRVGMMHIVCYLQQGSNVFETYWTTMRGVEAMDNSYRLLDLTVYGRQETWEDSPTGWPQRFKGKQAGNRQALKRGASRHKGSFWTDNFNGIAIHLNHRDVTLIAVSRGPLAKINAYKNRIGWSFPWVSCDGSDFNFGYHFSFTSKEIAEDKMYPRA